MRMVFLVFYYDNALKNRAANIEEVAATINLNSRIIIIFAG